MKIIGHPWIESERFVSVDSIDEIKRSPAASILLFGEIEDSIDMLRYCRDQGLPFAVESDRLNSLLFAHLFGARYIISSGNDVEEFQAVAQHYLFDMEILAAIDDENEIEKYARLGIDGVIFKSYIEKQGANGAK